MTTEEISKANGFLLDLKKVYQDRWIDINDNNLKFLVGKYNISNLRNLLISWNNNNICSIAYNDNGSIRHFVITK